MPPYYLIGRLYSSEFLQELETREVHRQASYMSSGDSSEPFSSPMGEQFGLRINLTYEKNLVLHLTRAHEIQVEDLVCESLPLGFLAYRVERRVCGDRSG